MNENVVLNKHLKGATIGFLCAVLFSGRVLADTPMAPKAYVTTSWGGTYYFEMIPPQWNRFKDGLLDNGHGIAYQVLRDGSQKELWRTDGWYSGSIFLAEGGVFLVRVEPEKEGNHVSKGDLALAFYRNGTLMKQYSTAELVKKPEMIASTVSHYYWLAGDVQRISGQGAAGKDYDVEVEPRLLLDGTFRLKTCDGFVHIFDVTTGNPR